MAASVTFSSARMAWDGTLEAGGIDDVGGHQLSVRIGDRLALGRGCRHVGLLADQRLPERRFEILQAERAVLQRLQQEALEILLLDLARRLERRGRRLGRLRLGDEARDLGDDLVGRQFLVVERGVERLGVGVRLARHGVHVLHVRAVGVGLRGAGARAEHDEPQHEHEHDDAHDRKDPAHVGAVAAAAEPAAPATTRHRRMLLRLGAVVEIELFEEGQRDSPGERRSRPRRRRSRRRRPLRMSEPLQDAPILAPDLPRTPCPGAVS